MFGARQDPDGSGDFSANVPNVLVPRQPVVNDNAKEFE
jgi:hypothetical protein